MLGTKKGCLSLTGDLLLVIFSLIYCLFYLIFRVLVLALPKPHLGGSDSPTPSLASVSQNVLWG